MNDANSFDVFISYHGGRGNPERSSYNKAEEFRTYLEKRGVKAFLCKHENNDDFYDSINRALLVCKHLVLIACDKDMLSEWVYDEIKQFDSLRKNGEKPNCVINAYIYGNIIEKDLYTLNTLFSSKDIKSGEGGFEDIYNQIISMNNIEDSVRSLTSEKTISAIKYIDFTNIDIEKEIFAQISKLSENDQEVWKKYVSDLFSIYDISAFPNYLKEVCNSCNILIARLHDKREINMIISNLDNDFGTIDYIFFVVISKGVVTDGSIFDVSSKEINQLECKNMAVFGNVLLCIGKKCDKCTDDNVMCILSTGVRREIAVTNKILRLSVLPQEGDDIPVLHTTFNNDVMITNTQYIPLMNKDVLSYYVDMILNGLNKNNIINSDIDFELRTLFDIDYDLKTTVSENYTFLSKFLHHELTLRDYYISFRSTGQFDEKKYLELQNTNYGDIVTLIRDYYIDRDAKSLSRSIELLYHEYNRCIEERFHYKKEMILLFISEVLIHNAFVLKSDLVNKYHVIKELEEMVKVEGLPPLRLRLMTMLCALKKEKVFGGDYKDIAPTIELAIQKVSSEFNATIADLNSEQQRLPSIEYKWQLLLLYRQRAVIWEHFGDNIFDNDERVKYYKMWQDDSLVAIDMGKTFDSDREVLGCAYLNYASSLNRLSKIAGDEDKLNILDSCVDYLDIAYNLLRGISPKRLIGYVFLHKADCYEEMNAIQKSQKTQQMMFNMATKGYAMFKESSDFSAIAWCLRLMAKGNVYLSESQNLKESINLAFEKIYAALTLNSQCNNMNGIACCICDFTEYLDIIDKNNLRIIFSEEINKIFFFELDLFASIARELTVDSKDIDSIQNAIENIVMKLII